MFIERPPEWFRKLFPQAVFRLPGNGEKPGVVYLTFDDGPIPEATPIVLDILDRYKVKATFFMVGENIMRYPGIFEEVMKRGHKVANHTYHHVRGFGVSPEDYVKDVEKCERLTNTRLLRPPHGWMTPSQFKALKKDHKIVFYDLITRDYSKHTTSDDVINNIRKYSRDGSIIVFHDSLKSIGKLESALPLCLEWLSSNGYKFSLL